LGLSSGAEFAKSDHERMAQPFVKGGFSPNEAGVFKAVMVPSVQCANLTTKESPRPSFAGFPDECIDIGF
jgi:hypothetical protein